MQVYPGALVSRLFPLVNPTTLQRANAEGLPTAVLYRNGQPIGIDPNVAGGVQVAIANVDTGLYRASYTVPANYVAGDDCQVVVTATVAGLENLLPLEVDGVEARPLPQIGRLINGPYRLQPEGARVGAEINLFVGDTHALGFDLVDGAGNPVAIGDGTIAVRITENGALVSNGAGEATLDPGSSFFTYDLQTADTTAARRLKLTAALTDADGAVTTFGPAMLSVRAR